MTDHDCDAGACGFPDLVRMSYFHGQMLSPRDFLAEQTYHRARHALVTRCLLGWGVVCGLHLTPRAPAVACPEPVDDKRKALDDAIAQLEAEARNAEAAGAADKAKEIEIKLEALRREREQLPPPASGQCDVPPPAGAPDLTLDLSCGLAIAPSGAEIIVGETVVLDLDRLFDQTMRSKRAAGEALTLWLSLCYAETGSEPVRPGALDQCQTAPECRDARIRSGWRASLSLDPPAADVVCEPCCQAACENCVVIAQVFVGAGANPVINVDMNVRRAFALYQPVTITGINWRHGGTYKPADAQRLSGADGGGGAYEISFSGPVQVASIQRGVIDVIVHTGGKGQSGTIGHVAIEYVDLPASGMVDRILFRDVTEERPQRNDRILIKVRCDHLLDSCSRPVDGNHVGGLVPELIDEGGAPPQPPYAKPPGWPGRRWTSGNGTPGGTFESWFFIADEREAKA